MIFIKLQLCIIVSIIIFHSNKVSTKSTDRFTGGARFKAVKCENDETSINITYCFLKPVSRSIVTLNVGAKLLVPYKKPLYVQILLNYRYGTIFRQIIDTHQQEWCEIMSGNESNKFIAYFIELLSKSAPTLFHECPYDGEINLRNVTINPETYGQKARIFPQGDYRLDLIVFQNDKQTVKVSIILEIKSRLKESFG